MSGRMLYQHSGMSLSQNDCFAAYDAYFAGKLENVELSQSRIDAAIEELPSVPAMP